jgi:HEAT repeat protein
MSDFSEQEFASVGDERRAPEDLPPIEPPSAGFIVQLFLVPALIVMVIVGVWVLFGKLASSEQDWRQLVAELKSGNEHRRWRGALGLAQILKADEERGVHGQQLAANPEIAQELSGLLREELRRHSQKDDDLKQQAFLARTLGFLDVPQTVVPVLQQAMQPEHDREVRKNAIASIALIAGRGKERGKPVQVAGADESLVEVSADADPLVRQLSAYALGLFPTQAAEQRLTVLTADADRNTRINAALALARQQSTAGMPVLKAFLAEAARQSPTQAAGEMTAAEADARDFQEPLIVKNSIKAIDDLVSQFTPAERHELIGLLEPIAANYRNDQIRVEAHAVLSELKRTSQ